jgi:predicted transcriptional regulator of viral defense system
VELLSWYPNQSALQRLGFLLDEIGTSPKLANKIFQKSTQTPFYPVLLSPSPTAKPGAVGNRWKVSVNINLESDL